MVDEAMTALNALRSLVLMISTLTLVTAATLAHPTRNDHPGYGSMGAGTPNITVTLPVPGQVIEDESVTVAWTASDPDGDALVFRVEFSSDAGVIWRTVAQDLTDQSVQIARTQIMASNQARFRVWASDGLNQVSDEIDGDVIVADLPPEVEISAPLDHSVFVDGSTISFSGSAFDVDAGPIGGFALTWHSSQEGFLGRGNNIASSTLRIGTHTISLRTPDDNGGYVEANIMIHIIASDLRLFVPQILR